MLRNCLLLAALVFVAIGSSTIEEFRVECQCFLLSPLTGLVYLAGTLIERSVYRPTECLSYTFYLYMEWVGVHRLRLLAGTI